MKKIIVATILFCFIATPLFAEAPRLGVEKMKAIGLAIDKIEAIKAKENNGTATGLDTANKELLRNNLAKFNEDLRAANTIGEFMVVVEAFKTETASIGNN